MFWDSGNRLNMNFLDFIHSQVTWSLFEHIKSWIYAKFGSRPPPKSKFSSTPMCAQNTYQNGLVFMSTQFWLRKTKCCEFSTHIALIIIVYGYIYISWDIVYRLLISYKIKKKLITYLIFTLHIFLNWFQGVFEMKNIYFFKFYIYFE